MGRRAMTKVERSIHEESEKIREARLAIKAQKEIIDNSDIIPEALDDKDWRDKEFSFPNSTVRTGTVFSGIGAIEHAFQRLKLKHKIVFAGDIDDNCKKSYFANYKINEEDWFSDIREFDASKYNGKVDFVIGGAPCQAFSMVGKRLGFEDARGTLFYEFARVVKETGPNKLFDRGFITFTENRHVILSEFISPFTWKQIGLKNDTFVKALPMDENRIKYLEFHHSSVFKGTLDNY